MPKVTEYFTGLASIYADHRPTYPTTAIDYMLDGLARPVIAADVGCGTGISTRLLAARGARVIGIDPNPDMLEQARRDSSTVKDGIEYRGGSGERTGLEDASVDLVVCAQAFHWFDAVAALREFHRILRATSGQAGRLALMWNIKAPRNPFSAAFIRLTERAQADAATRGLTVPPERAADAALGGFFTNIRQRTFDNPQALDLDGTLGRLRSASYFPRSGPVREELEGELHAAFEEFARNGRVELFHHTEVTLADRAA